MKRLMILLVGGVLAMSVFAQSNSQMTKPAKKNLTTVLGVSVGMDMKETLAQLQERSKRFHLVPAVGTQDGSLGLLMILQLKDVRLGWDDNDEMIADIVQVSFFKGKVVQIGIKGGENAADSPWQSFLCKIPKSTGDRSRMIGNGCMVNPIEHCLVKGKVLVVTDSDNWAAYLDEKKRLEEFFRSVPRADEILD